MFCRNRRKSVGRVTPSFVRNLRKGYLLPNGEPLPGKELQARTLLTVLHCLQEGKYIRALTLAQMYGFDLETMYRDYSLMVANTSRDFNKFLEGVEAFCKKYTTSMFVRRREA
jgi:hypothetical protein